MKSVIKTMTGLIPFVFVIIINPISEFMLKTGQRINNLKFLLGAMGLILLMNLLFAQKKKIAGYFTVAVSTVTLSGILFVFLLPQYRVLFLDNTVAALYIALFSAAFFPPLFNKDPFTYEYSKKDYPEAVHRMPLFKSINLILNYLWALLFALAFILTLVKYTDNYALQKILQNTLPMALQLMIGLPVTIKLPGILMSKGSSGKNNFQSVQEMFEAMPYGLNTKKAEGINAVVQFNLSGEEEISGYLTIENKECSYTGGIYPEPTTTITADSRLWLDISNGDLSGDEAYINQEYTVEGDAGFLLKLTDLFSPSTPIKKKTRKTSREKPYQYKTFDAEYIKRIFFVNASPRTEQYSKSLMMAKKFMAGAKSAGAEIEMVTLQEKTINYCTCCYTCWTKTPGVCIYKDDMPELLEKVRTADLVVYVTPLYVFSVSAQLKVFIDRMLPNMQPYMVKTDGLTHHPNRFEEDKPHGLVIFSAGGFPEVKKNFDGISAIVRNIGSHMATTNLMAEFFLPAAELLQQPVYRERKERIEEACFKAGLNAVKKGEISREYMEVVADPEIDQETFMDQANLFWKSLDGKKSYYKGVTKLT